MATGIDLYKNGKKWTDEEEMELYRLSQTTNKKWVDIAKVFNVSPDACRNKYKRTNWDKLFLRNKTNEVDFIKKSMSNLENATINQTVSIEDEKKQALIDIEKHKILQRSNDRLKKEEVEKRAMTEIIVDKIQSSIYKVPNIETDKIIYPKYNFKHRPQEACLMLSDLHIGLACIPEEVGGLGHYNMEVFKERLKNLITSITKITDYHRKSYKVDTLNIFALGDNVHGSNDVGKWGFLHTEQNIMDQIFCAIKELTESILTLKKVFKNINFYGVVGNHARVAKVGIEKSYVSWDYILYNILETSLSNNKDIKFKIPKAPFQIAQVLNNKFLLIHGDTIKSFCGLPFYGMVRAENRYQSMISQSKNIEELWNEIETKKIDKKNSRELLEYALNYSKPFQTFVMGHMHQPTDIPVGVNNIMCNGAFVGGDDYTINQLMTNGYPSQKFFGVHEEGISWKYDINLDRK